ncbi:MAG TPA: hypothetical protein VKT32_05220 [Chthonomonadaceae bacterium]|nr:hypothetical protein [Chthonomonadaceae bacterium]
MRKSSWVVIAVCILLAGFLAFAYLWTPSSPETLTQQDGVEIVHKLQNAVEQKKVNDIMDYVSPDPDVKIAGLNQDQLQLMLARAFHNSGNLKANVSNIALDSTRNEATLAFDVAVKDSTPNMLAGDYSGRITLHLRRVEIPHLMGLLHAREWKIVGAETTGPDPSTFGD